MGKLLTKASGKDNIFVYKIIIFLMSTMVRVTDGAKKKLKAIAQQKNISLQKTLDILIDAEEKRIFWDRVNEEFSKWQEDEVAWQAELEERALWDGCLLDGLKDDPPWPQ